VHRKEDAVSSLLHHHSPLNPRDNNGNTPLHLAALYNSTTIVNLLLTNGADRNMMNEEGETPELMAETYGNEWVSRCFAFHGSDEEEDDDAVEKEEMRKSAAASAAHGKGSGGSKFSIKVRVGGQEVVYDDVEMVEVAGDHNLEALVPPVA